MMVPSPKSLQSKTALADRTPQFSKVLNHIGEEGEVTHMLRARLVLKYLLNQGLKELVFQQTQRYACVMSLQSKTKSKHLFGSYPKRQHSVNAWNSIFLRRA